MPRQQCVLTAVAVAVAVAGSGCGSSEAAWKSVSGAAKGAAGAVENEAGTLVQQGENLTGSALNQAENQGCDMKTGQDIYEVNQTMASQLQMDCATQAAKVDYMREKILGSCMSMGLWNINRTLEEQRSKLKEDCIKFLRRAPGDLAGTLAAWSQQSQKSLSETLGPQIQSAVDKAAETVQGEEEKKSQNAQAKFSVSGPPALTHGSVAPIVLLPVLLASLLVSLGSLAAWRRAGSRLAPVGGQLLPLTSDSDGVV